MDVSDVPRTPLGPLARDVLDDLLPPMAPPRPPPSLNSAVSSLFRSASTPPPMVDNSWTCWPRTWRPPSAPSGTHYVPYWSPATLPAPPEIRPSPAAEATDALPPPPASFEIYPLPPLLADDTRPQATIPPPSSSRRNSSFPSKWAEDGVTQSLDLFRPPSVLRPPSSPPPPIPTDSRPLSSSRPPSFPLPSVPPDSRPPSMPPINSRPPSGLPPLPSRSRSSKTPPPVPPKPRPPTRPPPDPPAPSAELEGGSLESLLPPPPLFQTPTEQKASHVTFFPTEEVIPLVVHDKGGYLDSRDGLGQEQQTPAVIGGLLGDTNTRSKETDLLFLESITKAKSLEDLPSGGNLRLALQLSEECDRIRNGDAWELANILRKPHLKALLDTHDVVTGQKDQPDVLWEFQQPELPITMTSNAVRMVGLRKNPNEPLGMTVQVDDNGNLVIARILAGGMIERQGLLHVGDVILEVNGYPVESPEILQDRIADSKEAVTLKIAPGKDDTSLKVANGRPQNNVAAQEGVNSVCFMRALFNYNPLEDTLLPCKEIGLEFQHGDILQIVNQRDPNWWQAKKVGWNGPAGLIPSQELEERRKAFVAPEADYVHKIGICGTRISKKKKKVRYQSKANTDYDKAELILYEEVTRMPPFKRKTLALIGSQGVGRRTLKNRLINSDPEKFGTIIPYTSRPQREYEDNGKSYWFADRESMEMDIRQHKFLEYGEHNGHLYGTTLDSIREVHQQGKMCVLDCSAAALKVLHNSSEFMPYVIFIAAPGMEQLKSLHNYGRGSRNFTFDRQSSIRFSSQRARTLQSLSTMFGEEDLLRTLEESACLQRTYEKYIDYTIINEDHDETFRKVLEQLETLSTEHQWVPVNWVY